MVELAVVKCCTKLFVSWVKDRITFVGYFAAVASDVSIFQVHNDQRWQLSCCHVQPNIVFMPSVRQRFPALKVNMLSKLSYGAVTVVCLISVLDHSIRMLKSFPQIL